MYGLVKRGSALMTDRLTKRETIVMMTIPTLGKAEVNTEDKMDFVYCDVRPAQVVARDARKCLSSEDGVEYTEPTHADEVQYAGQDDSKIAAGLMSAESAKVGGISMHLPK